MLISGTMGEIVAFLLVVLQKSRLLLLSSFSISSAWLPQLLGVLHHIKRGGKTMEDHTWEIFMDQVCKLASSLLLTFHW